MLTKTDMNGSEINKMVMRLSSLNERELIDVLNRVFAVYATRFDGDGISPNFGRRYSLVSSDFTKGEDNEPYIQFLASPSEPYLLEPNDGAWDNGVCPTCGVCVACTNKLATCPVCGTEKVECT